MRHFLLAALVAAVTIAGSAGLLRYLMASCVQTRSRDVGSQFGIALEHNNSIQERLSIAGVEGRVTTTVHICLRAARELAVERR